MRYRPTVEERYENKYKTRKNGEWDINFEFQYDEKKMDIFFCSRIVEKKITISIHNKYDIESNTMTEEIDFFDDTKELLESEIEEISKIKEYLQKNNISIKDLKETADELLYEKVIGDWEKYTNSRYSKDNLGTVKIERSPLFNGVD